MFLFVMNWADDESTHVNIHCPQIRFWSEYSADHLIPGHSPRRSAECISSAALGSYTAVALTFFCVPFHKSLLGNRSLTSTSAMLYPNFPCLSVKSNTNPIFYCQVAVNCDQESRVTWGMYAQPDLTRCQYTGAPTDKNDSTFWPGRSHHKLFSDAKGFHS